LCTEAVSSSALKELYYGKNPQYCYQKYIAKTIPNKQTDAMLIGSATHKLILEPRSFNKEFAVWSGGRRAGGEWKAFKEFHDDKDIITQAQYDEIRYMRDAVRNNSEASTLLSNGEAERSVFWRDEETNVLCRARADYQKQSGSSNILVDLKTCMSAEPEKFAKDLINLGYPLQEAMYREGFKADAFAFVAVEKGTNTVQVYTLDDLFDQAGHFIFRQALERWAECLETKVWPTYRTGVSQLDCPEWWANKVLAYE
jgi:exodeoxyribonuclease VIII